MKIGPDSNKSPEKYREANLGVSDDKTYKYPSGLMVIP
jgi:hypothetical protein